MLKSIGDFSILRNIHTQFANSIGMNKYSDNNFASYFESLIKSHVNWLEYSLDCAHKTRLIETKIAMIKSVFSSCVQIAKN